MSGKVIRVLSIDWDYFIDASWRERSSFPDPNEMYSPKLVNMLWMFHYAQHEELEKIGIRSEDLQSVVITTIMSCSEGLLTRSPKINEDFCTEQGEFGSFYLMNSHKHLYNVCSTILKENPDSKMEIYNIDFHHDYYLRKDEVTCGNWARALTEDFPGRLSHYWVSHKTSDRILCIHGEANLKEVPIESIDNKLFDVIYVCKSPEWSPPHLDSAFIGNFRAVSVMNNAIGQQGALEDRFKEKIFKDAPKVRKTILEAKKKHEGIGKTGISKDMFAYQLAELCKDASEGKPVDP